VKTDKILVLDLGSTENTRVVRAVRALGVYSEIQPHDITKEEIEALGNVKGIILNGGPNRVVDGVKVDIHPNLYDLGLPIISAQYDDDYSWPEDDAKLSEVLKTFVLEDCACEK